MARHHGNVLDLFTEDDLKYQYYPISCGSVQFTVRANNDAHLAFTTGPEVADPMYEVIIGGWGNTKSVIRKNRDKSSVAEVETPMILNKDEARSFWIRWDNGTIAVGRERESEFMSWVDPDPFSVNFVGVCTGWNATGTWKIEDQEEFNTPNELEYIFRPVTAGYVQFEYRGPHNAHLCLTAGPNDDDKPLYEFVLGGWNNTESVIRRSEHTEQKKPTPGIMSPQEFRKFLIEWKNGRMLARDGVPPGRVLLDWEDRSPSPVTHFGVRTGHGARGHWRILHFPVTSSANLILPPKEVSEVGKWVGAAHGRVPAGAVVGGRDTSGKAYYVVRAPHESGLIPGKLAESKNYANIPWNGYEYAKSEYQVLVGGSDKWTAATGDKIPSNAFPSGHSEAGEPLYVGRVSHDGHLVPGKVHKSHGACFIPYNGVELSFTEYEILLM